MLMAQKKKNKKKKKKRRVEYVGGGWAWQLQRKMMMKVQSLPLGNMLWHVRGWSHREQKKMFIKNCFAQRLWIDEETILFRVHFRYGETLMKVFVVSFITSCNQNHCKPFPIEFSWLCFCRILNTIAEWKTHRQHQSFLIFLQLKHSKKRWVIINVWIWLETISTHYWGWVDEK